MKVLQNTHDKWNYKVDLFWCQKFHIIFFVMYLFCELSEDSYILRQLVNESSPYNDIPINNQKEIAQLEFLSMTLLMKQWI